MERIGIIDLGSNTVRLVVFDVDKDAGKHLKGSEFKEILNERTVAGLSAYVQDNTFTEDGIECALDVLRDHLKAAKNVDCKHVHIFATAVLRNCKNSAQVVKVIEKETGLSIDLISGEEEAHLGFVGASISQKLDGGSLIDIGGGSTEFTLIEKGEDVRNISFPQGSVSSYAQYVRLILPTQTECAAIREGFRQHTNMWRCMMNTHGQAMFGIGGSVRAVAKMLGRMSGSDKMQKQMSLADVERVMQLLDQDPSQFAHVAVKAAPERLHSIVPGCIILHELMRATGAPAITVCKYGVREGYLIEHVLK